MYLYLCSVVEVAVPPHRHDVRDSSRTRLCIRARLPKYRALLHRPGRMTVRWCHRVSRSAVFALGSNMLAPRQDVKLAGGNNGAKSVARVVSFSSSSPSRCDCVQERPYQRVAVGRINGDSQSSAPWADPTVSSDENIFLERSSSGSTRNAAATRPQANTTWVCGRVVDEWFIDA